MMASRGYDMTPTMYSPDGRIYQVEYAIETVKRGAIAIGVQVKDGVILAVEEKSRDLQVEDITQKIFQVDDHIGIAAAGYIPDARVMVDSARFFSQSNKLTYDETVEIEAVAKHLADQSHQFTQYSGVRPFGVALIIAGSLNKLKRKGSTLSNLSGPPRLNRITALFILTFISHNLDNIFYCLGFRFRHNAMT